MARTSISDRLKQVMELKGLSQVEILKMAEPFCQRENVKLSKSKLSQYVNGKFNPDQGMIDTLAEVLDVNPAWLAGYEAPMKREAPTSDDNADERMEKVRELFPRISPFEQRRIIAILEKKASEK